MSFYLWTMVSLVSGLGPDILGGSMEFSFSGDVPVDRVGAQLVPLEPANSHTWHRTLSPAVRQGHLWKLLEAMLTGSSLRLETLGDHLLTPLCKSVCYIEAFLVSVDGSQAQYQDDMDVYLKTLTEKAEVIWTVL
ncbi:hypothetical protein ACOMHN_053160 [Nucella lapillus]